MVDLPKKKVGIVACSGEELPEGTVTRLAALQVLEQLRPGDTVTICLPLFLAGGEGDRAFARFYPTVAVDGCEQRCAARATEMYSGKPAAGIVITELVAQNGLGQPQGRCRLDEAGRQAVRAAAQQIAGLVDELLDRHWNRRSGEFKPSASFIPLQVLDDAAPVEATCACGSGIPVRKVMIAGQPVALAALPLIFEQFHKAGRQPDAAAGQALLEMVKIYNPIPAGDDESYAQTLLREYAAYCREQEQAA
jgi:hypothetical protein